jgi:oligopeptidase B
MRDDSRTNLEVLEHIKNENLYTDMVMNPHSEIKKEIYDEVKSYIKEEYDSYKYETGDKSIYKYFRRYLKDKDYHIECRINTSTNEIINLLDINKLAENKTQCNVINFYISPNHEYISYGIEYDGSEKCDIIIQEIETGLKIEHTIPKLMFCKFISSIEILLHLVILSALIKIPFISPNFLIDCLLKLEHVIS